jgi:uncharacterized damage-inducible protein DinB
VKRLRKRAKEREMNKFSKLAGIVLATGLMAMPLLAQDTKKKEAPKPATSKFQAVLDQWNDIGRKLTAMAEDFPEDKYEFKPKLEMRSFREALLHVADTNQFFISAVKGEKPPEKEDFSKDKVKSKAEVAAYVKKSFADGAAAITAKGEAGLDSMVVDPYGNQYVRVTDEAYGFTEHSGEHYGSLVVYYRLNGLVPPESRPKK